MVRIGFSTRRRSVLSWIVRTVTGSKISHAWFLVRDPLFGDQELVIEATDIGFRALPLAVFAVRNMVIDIVTPRFPLDDGFRLVSKSLGSPYDFLGLFGMVFVLLFGRWSKAKIRNPFQSSRALFCSEAIAAALQDPPYPGWSGEASGTTPQDLYAFFSNEDSVEVFTSDTP